MNDIKVIVSTDNGTSEQWANSLDIVLLFVQYAMKEPSPGRVVIIVENLS